MPARRGPEPLQQESMRFVLDAGALVAEEGGNQEVRALFRSALSRGAVLIVPPVVVTQIYRGNPRDVAINRRLDTVFVPEVDKEFAMVAGGLLAAAGINDAADAHVAAEAHA